MQRRGLPRLEKTVAAGMNKTLPLLFSLLPSPCPHSQGAITSLPFTGLQLKGRCQEDTGNFSPQSRVCLAPSLSGESEPNYHLTGTT